MRDEALAAYHDLPSKAREGNAIRKAADAGIKVLSKTATKDKQHIIANRRL
jgi:hypothetical protein